MRQRRAALLCLLYKSIWFVAMSRFCQSSFSLGVTFRKTKAHLLPPKLSTAPSNDTTDTKMIVIFGRAGAGKTSVAEAAIDLLSQQDESIHCIGLDLDVCVPQWMRDNFGEGIYPTLKERGEFAANACDYVDSKLVEQYETLEKNKPLVAIISFSFVNTDLRDVFRSRFPNAMWALVDTNESEADKRIRTREGHFYKGAPESIAMTSDEKAKKTPKIESDCDNIEWEFAPVTFPHTVLPGNESIQSNARTIVDELLTEIDQR